MGNELAHPSGPTAHVTPSATSRDRMHLAPAPPANLQCQQPTESIALYLPSIQESPMYDAPTLTNTMNAWSELKEEACKQDDPSSPRATAKEQLYAFWQAEIESLSAENYNKAAILFYCNVFELVPSISQLFNKNIELQAKQYWGMMRWVIAGLKQPDDRRMKSRVRILGKLHQKLNVKQELFTAFLQAFHETMHETVGEKYTPQTQFIMEELYSVIISIMIGKDFESMPTSTAAHILKSLGSIQDCLKNSIARNYLEIYAKELFCVELLNFYTDYERYKRCNQFMRRQEIASGILKRYIGANAECPVSVSHASKKGIYQSLRENHNIFVLDVFDEVASECLQIIKDELWDGFKRGVIQISIASSKRV